jgi:LMBR1 domain-containing protein 1
MLIVVVALILFISFAFLRHADIPVVANTVSYAAASTQAIFIAAGSSSTTSVAVRSSQTLVITVSFPIYAIAITTFVGWFFLIIFLGSGLVALPLDLINAWRFRPIPMKEDEF